MFASALIQSNGDLAKVEHTKFISEVPLISIQKDFSPYYKVTKALVDGKHTLSIEPTPMAYAIEGTRVEEVEVHVTSATSWKHVRELEAPLFKKALADKLPAKYEAIVRSAKKMSGSKAIFDHVAEEISKIISYSGDWQSFKGKMQPKPMAAVVAQGKGDCKDYTTAMVAILRKLNYDANPFLTFRSKSYAGMMNLVRLTMAPSPAYFNHVIVHVTDQDKKQWWIDPTNPYVQADYINYDILGNFGLLLNDTNDKISFLPMKNPTPSDFYLEQTLQIGGDNSVSGQGYAKISPGMSNAIGTVNRLYGKEGTTKVFTYLLHPGSTKTALELKYSPTDKMRYDYDLHAGDWVTEQKGFKSVAAVSPMALFSSRVGLRADTDLGEPGTTTVISHIKGQKDVDAIRSNCFLRSRWLDADRYVENKADEIFVKDVVTVKQRFISKYEAQGDSFEVFLNDVDSCARTSSLVLKLDDTLKTAEFKDRELLMGPPIETMVEADADKLFDLPGPKKSSYAHMKIIRYYQKKLEKDPTLAEAYYRMSESILMGGYTSGDNFSPDYVKESIVNIEKAITYGKPDRVAFFMAMKIKFLLFLNKQQDAIAIFTDLNSKYPKNFYTYVSAFRIAEKQGKFDDAEKRLKAGEPMAVTKIEKAKFHSLMFDLYYEQNKFKEAIIHQEYATKDEPDNAWAWHNLAILYFSLGEYDKTIATEEKALAISEFGAAKKMISDSYLQKAVGGPITIRVIASNTASTTVDRPAEFENFLLKAVKYSPYNVRALRQLASYNVDQFIKNKNEIHLSKSRTYLQQALQHTPGDPETVGL